MNVKILKTYEGILVDADILNAKDIKIKLPSLTDNWRFNFNKHTKHKNIETYVLISRALPNQIEGCLTFEMKDKKEPYMAYIEVAPHNKGKARKYDRIAGCLIAFACRLSFIKGQDDYNGYLAFDVLEEIKEDEVKLMAMYSDKYNALRIGNSTTMLIIPEGGKKLIDEFLKIDNYES
ncbi:hypothetical protein HMPREF9711_02260 [Myroides odoratimimus CCUG 3837]|uniref:hypothetical protein n=1 Tax=Myroides odoratimimus TaxID=76832 RepID=UPI000280A6E4|nr:hypothetical protein [Myroides odoratimimus]EKB03815.1 hypothetical protein HMPREF9711_02260 [Myroides odoratimimus CCUG 3837]